MGVSTRAPVVSSTPLAGTTQVLAVSAVTQRGELVKAYAAQPVFFRGTLGGCVSKVPHKFGQGLCRPSFQEKWCHRPFFFPPKVFLIAKSMGTHSPWSFRELFISLQCTF